LFPIAAKATRLALIIVGKVHWYPEAMAAANVWDSSNGQLRAKWHKAEWTLQMADNGYEVQLR
jgi:hypothetical protein